MSNSRRPTASRDDLNRLISSARNRLNKELTSIAEVVQPLVVEYFNSLPHETYEQKKLVAKELNACVASIGLALMCPKTGLTAYLVADPGGNKPESGRFQLSVAESSGGRKRSMTSVDMPPIRLIPFIDRHRRQNSWAEEECAKPPTTRSPR